MAEIEAIFGYVRLSGYNRERRQSKASRAIDQVSGAAADLIDFVVVENDAEFACFTDLGEEVGARVPPITVIKVTTCWYVIEVPVSLEHATTQRKGHRLGKRTCVEGSNRLLTVVTKPYFQGSTTLELGRFGRD